MIQEFTLKLQLEYPGHQFQTSAFPPSYFNTFNNILLERENHHSLAMSEKMDYDAYTEQQVL